MFKRDETRREEIEPFQSFVFQGVLKKRHLVGASDQFGAKGEEFASAGFAAFVQLVQMLVAVVQTSFEFFALLHGLLNDRPRFEQIQLQVLNGALKFRSLEKSSSRDENGGREEKILHAGDPGGELVLVQ